MHLQLRQQFPGLSIPLFHWGKGEKSFHSSRGIPFLSHIIMDAKTAATKAGLEESTQSLNHRIRITLTSTKTKALEQGKKLFGENIEIDH